MRTAAILPVKRFSLAKQRLGASVAEELRVELARAMVADVLLALSACASIERTIVVTGEGSLAASANAAGALVVDDPAESGQSAAASRGIECAAAEGIERALCIPGDCPALEEAELDALLGDGARSPEVVIVPDRHGSGTNGLLLAPAGVIEPGFGPGSFERHLARARAAGAAVRIERPPSLLLDIDTGADLDALRERLSRRSAGAPHTRAVLDGAGRAQARALAPSA